MDEAAAVVEQARITTTPPTTDETTIPAMLDREEAEEKEVKAPTTADEAIPSVEIEVVEVEEEEAEAVETEEEAGQQGTRVWTITVRVGMMARMSIEAPVVVEGVVVLLGRGTGKWL